MKIKGAATKTRRGQIKKFKKNISENWEVIVSVSERKSWLTLITVPSPLWAAQGWFIQGCMEYPSIQWLHWDPALIEMGSEIEVLFYK